MAFRASIRARQDDTRPERQQREATTMMTALRDDDDARALPGKPLPEAILGACRAYRHACCHRCRPV